MFIGKWTEVIFKLKTLNAVKFLPAVNGEHLTPLNFNLTLPSYAYKAQLHSQSTATPTRYSYILHGTAAPTRYNYTFRGTPTPSNGKND